MSDTEITLEPVIDFNRMCNILGVQNVRPELDESKLADLPDGDHTLFLNSCGIVPASGDKLPRLFSYWKLDNMTKSASLSYSLKQEAFAKLTSHLVSLELKDFLPDAKGIAECANAKNVWVALAETILKKWEPLSYAKSKARKLTIEATVTTDSGGYKVIAE